MCYNRAWIIYKARNLWESSQKSYFILVIIITRGGDLAMKIMCYIVYCAERFSSSLERNKAWHRFIFENL